MGATEGLFMTFAFGMNDIFKDVYQNSRAPFRLALLEKQGPADEARAGARRRGAKDLALTQHAGERVRGRRVHPHK